MTFRFRVSRSLRLGLGLIALVCGASAWPQETSVGDLRIGHPYATPSLPGSTTGAAYLVSIENAGSQPDRLLRASTPAAARVEMHSMAVDAQGVMRMREVAAIALAPRQTLKMQPGGAMHFMLIGLKKPLKDGDTLPMTLQFERAGSVEVKLVVQTPRPSMDMPEMHRH